MMPSAEVSPSPAGLWSAVDGTTTSAPTGNVPAPPDAVSTAPVTAAIATRTAVRGRARQVAERPPESSFMTQPTGHPLPTLATPVCAASTTADGLTSFFDGRAPMTGADYQRAYPLPGGRVLWLFQDAFLPTAAGARFVHNAGLLQSGECFQLLRTGTEEAPAAYLLPELTDPYRRWFWPLGGGIGTDGDLHVFIAEMVELGERYLSHTLPTATWLVTIDADTLTVLDRRLAPNPSAALYGWSVVSAGDHTYLYAHCNRQFGFDPLWFAPEVLAHDLGCTADVTVARIERGRYGTVPLYWNGTDWVDDPDAATPVIPTGGRTTNPTQVAVVGDEFIAVTKVGDWWGHEIVLDRAPSAEGPWERYGTVEIEPECDRCNTYFASIVPYGADGDSFIAGLSCNTWTGDGWLTGHYDPSFIRVQLP